MSEKRKKAARKTGSTAGNRSGQNAKGKKSTGVVKNASSAKFAANSKNAKNTNIKNVKNTNTNTAKGKGFTDTQASKRVFWIPLVTCVSTLLVAALVVVLVFANKGNSNTAFFYSDGIAENGFWEDTVALDYVEPFDWQSFLIPKEIHEILKGNIYYKIYNLLDDHSFEIQEVTDRAIVDGDKVHIDFVGSVDGVEFSGGSTDGEGAEVVAGSSRYIDDFLTQIIGHMPGETFDVEVTFPEDYGSEDLNGKEAVFVVTINYIIEYNITDELIQENLYDEYGWETLGEMEKAMEEELQKAAIENYVSSYMGADVTLYSIPDKILAYQEKYTAYMEKTMLDYYQMYADLYGIELDAFLQYYVGVAGKDALIKENRDYITEEIKRSLAVQAVAEDAGISVSDADMEKYLPEYLSYEEEYGMPWLKQHVLGLKVLDYIVENAVLA